MPFARTTFSLDWVDRDRIIWRHKLRPKPLLSQQKLPWPLMKLTVRVRKLGSQHADTFDLFNFTWIVFHTLPLIFEKKFICLQIFIPGFIILFKRNFIFFFYTVGFKQIDGLNCKTFRLWLLSFWLNTGSMSCEILKPKGFLFWYQSTTVYFWNMQYGMWTIQCVTIVCEKNG